MNNVTTEQGTQHAIISDIALANLGVLFKLVLNPTLGTMGTCANAINIVVFYRMGLSDGVTQNFFILAVSDGCIAFGSLISSAAYLLQTTVYLGVGGPEYQVQVVYWTTLLVGSFLQNTSLVTTVVIAVVRCCCVAMPLQVKHLLTAPRQLAAILVFSGGSIAALIYFFSPAHAVVVYNPLTNSSLAFLADLRWYEYTLFSNTFFYIGFIIVIICAIILTISLKRSSRFRETSASGYSSTSGSAADAQVKDGRREARVVKTVVFVAIVFILCYIPSMVFTVTGSVVSEFSANGDYRNANMLTLMVTETSLLVNAAVNICIYYFHNSRYRTVFNTIFEKETK
ncbi:chemosensory receptor A [Elysia marginata]|uniref:Chemosensory receptor A n=1 Tax=Elysia marginata TaxID=1093978 RepID=A0AAV4I3Q0_9GAST|nr:chemosensory receptor A [Elysia marginata]